jgi:hypothetical protein
MGKRKERAERTVVAAQPQIIQTTFSQTRFLSTEDLRYLENPALRSELFRLLDGTKQDIEMFGKNHPIFRLWQEEIGWVLRESQCRMQDEKNSLYDTEFANIYRTNIYERRA